MSDELNRHYLSVDVKETDSNRAYWIDKSWISPIKRSTLVKSDLLLVPNENFRDSDEPYFPKGTESFVENLRNVLPESINFGIAFDDERYQEIALHADVWRIPTLLLTAAVIPVLLNIFSNRLDEVLPGHKNEDLVEMNLIVETSNKKAIKIKFKGPTTEIAKLLAESVPSYLAALEQTPKINKTVTKIIKKHKNAS